MTKKDASKSDSRHTLIVNLTTPRMTKETASFIEKLAEKDSKRTKKKEPKTTEGGIVRRLAKQGLSHRQIESKSSAKIDIQEEDDDEEEEEKGPWLLIIFIIILRLLLIQLQLLMRL